MVVNSCPNLHVYKFTRKNGEGARTKSGKHVKSQHKMTEIVEIYLNWILKN